MLKKKKKWLSTALEKKKKLRSFKNLNVGKILLKKVGKR